MCPQTVQSNKRRRIVISQCLAEGIRGKIKRCFLFKVETTDEMRASPGLERPQYCAGCGCGCISAEYTQYTACISVETRTQLCIYTSLPLEVDRQVLCRELSYISTCNFYQY